MSAPRIDAPGYKGVHMRLTRDQGAPSEHLCQCGASAQEWAYDHRDPEELVSPEGKPYSLKPEHYAPMCVPCHRRFDKQDTCSKGHEFTEENTYIHRGHRFCRRCRRETMRMLRTR